MQAAPTLANLVAETTHLTKEEWLALRKIGGSDAATTAGLNPFKSRYALWTELIDPVDNDETNERMEWGKRAEPMIAEAFAQRTGLEVQPFPYLLSHPEHEWMTANIDRLVLPDDNVPEVLEIKFVGERQAENWSTDRVPDHYMLQGQHYLAVTGLPGVHFAALIGNREMRTFHVERDDQLIADLIAIEEDFWRLVLTKTPPAIDGSESSLAAVKRRFEAVPGTSMELTEDGYSALLRLAELKAERKVLDSEIGEIEAAMMDAMGANEAATYEGQVVTTWKSYSTTRFDVAAFKAARPDLVSDFSTTSTGRRFLPKIKAPVKEDS